MPKSCAWPRVLSRHMMPPLRLPISDVEPSSCHLASVRKTSQVLLARFLPKHADLIEPFAMGTSGSYRCIGPLKTGCKERDLQGAHLSPEDGVRGLVRMHMPCKDCIHAMLVQRLLHGLHHVIDLMLVRLVAVVPVRKVPYQFKVWILEECWKLLLAQENHTSSPPWPPSSHPPRAGAAFCSCTCTRCRGFRCHPCPQLQADALAAAACMHNALFTLPILRIFRACGLEKSTALSVNPQQVEQALSPMLYRCNADILMSESRGDSAHQGACMPTITHGVRLLSTEARSCCSHANCSESWPYST